ncbi:MAG: alpha/beta hydrolase [bacterium]|nr:alpha/beta hydrolase [bacterium]
MLKRKKLLLSIVLVCIIILAGAGIYVCASKDIAVPEKRQTLELTQIQNNIYLSEENFVETMQNEVEPMLESCLTDGYFKNGDISLYYRMYQMEGAEKSVVISHGFTEYADKYNEVIYYYLKSGYDVYIMEHRGHGNSTREVEDKGLVYISSFDEYAKDFKMFMDEVVVKNNGSKPMYLFAHSMGGAIATRFIENNQGYFKAAVLSAPMLDVNTGSTPEGIANLLANVMDLIGKEKSYLLGYGPYVEEYNFDGSSTSSKARYDYYYSKESANENYQGSGGSYAWLKAAVAETKNLLKQENMDKIQIPVLLFQAENDSLVEANGLYKLANGSDYVEFIMVEGAKHQLWSTPNELLIPYFDKVFDFYSQNN